MNKEYEKLLDEQCQTNRLLALLLAKGLKQNEAIIELNRAGFQPKEIAEILGTTSNTVSVALSIRKKKTISRIAKKKQ